MRILSLLQANMMVVGFVIVTITSFGGLILGIKIIQNDWVTHKLRDFSVVIPCFMFVVGFILGLYFAIAVETLTLFIMR